MPLLSRNNMSLSIVMVTRDAEDVIEETLKSVVGLWEELLVDDAGSTDRTVEIIKKYGGKIYTLDPRVRGDDEKRSGDDKQRGGNDKKRGMTRKNLGERKQGLVKKAKGDWILVLDADERVSEKLYDEILHIRGSDKITLKRYFVKKAKRETIAYAIPYQNYVFGKPVYWGGERYAKVRLFRRGYGRISPEPLHEEVILTQNFHKATPCKRQGSGLENKNIDEMRGVIRHHSFRTPWQLFTKFTRYAWIAAKMHEIASPSKTRDRNDTLQKLFLYGPHMFWARFIKEKGYKDGWRGLVLALAFGYMEGLTYWLLFIRRIFIRPGLPKG